MQGSEHALRQWSASYLAGSESTGKDYRVFRRLSRMLVDRGFVDVEEVMLPLPLCAWREGMCTSWRFSRARG